MDITVKPVGDQALELLFSQEISEDNLRRIAGAEGILRARLPGIVETVPGYASLLVRYDPCVSEFDALREDILRMLSDASDAEDAEGTLFTVPVCYGGVCGEDLPEVARHTSLSEDEVVSLHSRTEYRVYFLGFLPGFPYLGGLPDALETPRRQTPRTLVPSGSVGIGGKQTGVYPFASPGGWQLIGRTPLRLFDADRGAPYRAGDRIRFQPISLEEYEKLEKAQVSLWDWR